MKKIILFIALFFFLPTITTAHAQNPNALQNTAAPVTPTPTPSPVDYTLPYPGLLPDSPLYVLKVLRDRIVGFLIADPLKKAQFDILEADKRLVSSWSLLKKSPKESALIVTTLSKGENYVADAMTQIQLAKKQGLVVTDVVRQLKLSNAKHLEVVDEMEQASSGSLQQGIQNEEVRIKQFGDIIKNSMQK